MKFSIVTPSFNQARFLEQTMCSILDQDYPDFEYVVIDGGSDDGSVELIKKHAHRLAYWCSEPDEGQSHAIVKGFSHCTGDILLWLASDDFLLPGTLSTVARTFSENPEAEVVTGGCYYVDAENYPITNAHRYTLGVPATYDRFRFYEQDGISQQSSSSREIIFSANFGGC